MDQDVFDVVDADDNVIGQATREECHSQGLTHRTVMFFIFDRQGRIFVNRRSESKDVLPGKWSIVLGGHLDAGETYDEAVKREFREETGLSASPFTLGSFKKYIRQEKEHVRVYGFTVDRSPLLDPNETLEGEFMDVGTVGEILDKKDFLPETRTLYAMLLDHLKKR